MHSMRISTTSLRTLDIGFLVKWYITYNVYDNTSTSYEAYDVGVIILLEIWIIYNLIHFKDKNELHIYQCIKSNNVRTRWYITSIIYQSFFSNDTSICMLTRCRWFWLPCRVLNLLISIPDLSNKKGQTLLKYNGFFLIIVFVRKLIFKLRTKEKFLNLR